MTRFFTTVLIVAGASLGMGLLLTCGTGGEKPTIILATGWSARLDAVNNSKSEVLVFTDRGDGFVATNGPNATLYRPELSVRGRYSLSTTVNHIDSHGNPHGAGMFFGGSDLAGTDQAYTYFLVRENGSYLIKTRQGKITAEVKTWTRHAAVKAGKNQLRVVVGASETRFLVNQVEVHRAPNTGLHLAGLYGYRMVHDLTLYFSPLVCEPAT